MTARLAALLAPLLLAACAVAPPPPRRDPPIAYPASVRDRILRIAEAEWAEWGRITVGRDLPRPPSGLEGLPDNFPRVLAYWRAVPDAEAAGAVAANRALWVAAPGGAAGLWAEPAWSAAFVSYVMRSAGVDTREFTPSAAHSFYLDAIIRDAREYPATAPFIPRDIGERAPEPGDLICADRSRTPLRSWRDRVPEAGQFRPMHCDIVLRAAPGAVEAIGGNIADAVTLTIYPADATGILLPRERGSALVTVVENRLGRLPPFGPSPLVLSPLLSDAAR
ncbi:DUF2272 domain-containing protein [Roseomonas sp. CCTCC AB2023176]|uniref:DUF2272 domain-containing protein n=1 Tax=Roseomonas sp. CCTCC AB2023176 TaxID=3342640 RepID=UPI0035E20431